MSASDGRVGPGSERDAAFAEHMGSAGSLVAGQRYDEAEGEVLRALRRVPGDMRALNLLALVRFKLGRLEEARATYHEIAVRSPADPAVRRNLGLLALKAERIDEAISELELAASLAPHDKSSWSYLGFAYTRRGDTLAAAAAFRRGGQDAVADELEAAAPPSVIAPAPAELSEAAEAPLDDGAQAPLEEGAQAPFDEGAPSLAPEPAEVAEAAPADAPPSTPRTTGVYPAPVLASPPRPDAALGDDAGDAAFARSPSLVTSPPPISVLSSWDDAGARRSAETRAVPVVSFILSSLGLSPGGPIPAVVKGGAPVRLSARDGAHVRADAVLAGSGAPAGSDERAVRRVRGRPSNEWLGAALRPFFRISGPGDVWVAGTSNRWAAVTLDDDILYVREDRVLAFDGSVCWEAGRIPGDGLRLLQFRGRGQVVLQLSGMPAAIRITPETPARVSRQALFGWVGRIVAHRPRREGPLQISCEGEGVMLLETRRSRA